MSLRLSTGLANAILDTGSVKSQLEGAGGFWIDIYSGARPASPDLTATGTKLLTLSLNGGVNGVHFEATATDGMLEKDSGETWSGTGLANGTAGYFRIRTGADTGATDSTTAKRVDGTIATSGADMNLTSTAIVLGAPYTVSGASFTLPSAA